MAALCSVGHAIAVTMLTISVLRTTTPMHS